jgi:hypothetical protein
MRGKPSPRCNPAPKDSTGPGRVFRYPFCGRPRNAIADGLARKGFALLDARTQVKCYFF